MPPLMAAEVVGEYRRPGLNGATCHRFGAEPCLTESYEGGQPPCTIPAKGTYLLRIPSARWFLSFVRLQVLRNLEPATGIEPATCGLRIS